MVVGMSTACFFPNLYTEQAVDEIGKMHIKNIEVFFSCMSEYKMPFAKDVKKRAIDQNIDIYSIHALSLQFEPQLFTSHERSRNDSYDVYKQVLEAGAELGAKVYVFHGPSHVKRARKMHLNYEYIGEYLNPIAELAKQYDIKLSWENVHWAWYRHPDFPKRIAPYINSDNVYFTLDVKQAAQAGYNPVDYLQDTQGRLVNVHLCDYEYTDLKGMSPKLPFEGEMDMAAFRLALDSTGYNQAVIMEVYSSNYDGYESLHDNYRKVAQMFG